MPPLLRSRQASKSTVCPIPPMLLLRRSINSSISSSSTHLTRTPVANCRLLVIRLLMARWRASRSIRLRLMELLYTRRAMDRCLRGTMLLPIRIRLMGKVSRCTRRRASEKRVGGGELNYRRGEISRLLSSPFWSFFIHTFRQRYQI